MNIEDASNYLTYTLSHQHDLKQRLCTLRNTHTHTPKTLTPANLFMGVGSDEVIDALIRCFCVPGHDKILTCPPTYGMYAVSAQVNDIAIVHAPLAANKDFAVQAELINEKLSADPSIKLVYICSPGNPTGTLASKDAIRKVLEHPTWNGVVVIDEAYIDFAPDGTSLAEWTTEWPNLVVMQTMSKAFGLAGIRLGAAFASPEIAQLLNNMKAPYNISNITSQIGQQALSEDHLNVMRSNRDRIMEQRHRLYQQLPTVPGIGNFRGGLASNFLLVEMLDKPGGEPSNEVALAVYETLAERKGVVVRFRGKELGCEGCLRITVGTESEVTRLLKEIAVVLSDIHAHQNHVTNGQKEETKEVMANDVVS